MTYQHTQRSYVFSGLLLVIGVVTAVFVGLADSAASAAIAFGATLPIIVVISVIFSRLTVTVEGSTVTVAFGLGWPKKTIDLTEIESVEQVKNSAWLGFGVRWVPNGWMWNVYGLDAVQLHRTNGRVFRIGTDDPEALHAALDLALRQTR